MKDVDQALRDAVAVFDRLEVPYAVMGGIAVRAHSIPRATRDVDVTASLALEDIPRLAAAFEELGYSLPEAYSRGWTDQVAEMPLIKVRCYFPQGDVDVDIFIATTPFQRSLMERRQLADLQGAAVWVVSAEDMILLKLAASRPRDLVDVADILFMQGQLDETYMRTWAKRLDLSERLEKALREHPGDVRP
jgi:hypothetical protein